VRDSIVKARQTIAAARRWQIVSMRKAGLTYAEIGLRLSTTDQRVGQIIGSEANRQPEQP